MQDARKDWRQEEEEITGDEMVGWHHWLDGHEFEQAPGVGDGEGSLACCSPWGRKELDTTEWLNWTELNWRHLDGNGNRVSGERQERFYVKLSHLSYLILLKKKFFFLIWLLQVLVATCRIFTVAVWSSLLTRDQPQAPCIGSMESWSLDHQGSSYPVSF